MHSQCVRGVSSSTRIHNHLRSSRCSPSKGRLLQITPLVQESNLSATDTNQIAQQGNDARPPPAVCERYPKACSDIILCYACPFGPKYSHHIQTCHGILVTFTPTGAAHLLLPRVVGLTRLIHPKSCAGVPDTLPLPILMQLSAALSPPP